VHAYPEDLKVVIVGTGGLSHEIHRERTGFNNEEWRFLDDPLHVTKLTHTDYMRLGGAEGAEVIMWLAMRGALGDRLRKLNQNYYLATTTAMTVVLYEELNGRLRPRDVQLEGIEQIEGTYPFDLKGERACAEHQPLVLGTAQAREPTAVSGARRRGFP